MIFVPISAGISVTWEYSALYTPAIDCSNLGLMSLPSASKTELISVHAANCTLLVDNIGATDEKTLYTLFQPYGHIMKVKFRQNLKIR